MDTFCLSRTVLDLSGIKSHTTFVSPIASAWGASQSGSNATIRKAYLDLIYVAIGIFQLSSFKVTGVQDSSGNGLLGVVFCVQCLEEIII
jgi:hypothetical protein